MKNFNSFFNQLTAMPKRLAMVLTVLFTLGVGSMWAETIFSDEFANVGTGSSTSISSRTGWTSLSNCYAQYNSGLRLGSSKNTGSITKTAMTNIEGSTTLTVTFYLAKYNSDSGKMNITVSGGGTASTTTFTPAGNAGVTSTTSKATWTDTYKCTFTIENATSATTIKFATSSNRLILGPVTISTPDAEPDDPGIPEKTATSLEWSAATYRATIDGANTFPTLTTTPANLTGVTYSSSNTAAATINASTGAITLVAAGTTTITASYAGNETYEAAENATYTLTVESAQGGGGSGSGECDKWVEVDLAEIESTDDVVITVEKNGTIYAMPNNGGTKSPVVVVIDENSFAYKNGIVNELCWNIVKDGANFIIFPKGSTTTWLYCTNSNSGVRVGSDNTDYNTFKIADNGYLYNIGRARYLGVYFENGNPKDWRSYTTDPVSNSNNISNQTLRFYKYKECTIQTTPIITTSEGSLAFGNVTVNSSKQLTFTLSGSDLTANATLALSGTNASMFTVSPNSVNQSSGSINNQTITVTYTPTTKATHTATLTISSSGADNVTVSLTGTGIAQTANYMIKHYQQNLDGTYPSTPTDTETKSGEVGTEVTPTVKTYPGFTAPSTKTVTIKSDGSTVVTYQYTRNSYTLTWNLDGGTIVTAGTTAGLVKYGASLTAPTVTKEEYNFKNWNPSVPSTMPASDATYTAQWTPTYTVTWLVKGQEYNEGSPTRTAVDGVIEKIPTAPANNTLEDCGATKFMGWSESNLGSTGQDDAPNDLFTTVPANPISENKTFYAVFASVSGSGAPTAYTAGDIGNFVLAAKNGSKWYALPANPTVSSGKIQGVEITVTTTSGVEHVTTANASGYIWTIANATNGQTISDGSKYIYHSKGGDTGTNLTYGNSTSYTWKIEKESAGLTFQAMNEGVVKDRGMLVQGTQFGGYSLSNETTSGYYRISVLPISDGASYTNYITNCCELLPVTNLQVSGVTEKSATLTWTKPSSTTGITELQIRNTNDDVIVDDINPTTTTATIDGLYECTKYNYYVVSVGAECEVSSETVTAQPFSGAKIVNYDYNGGSGSPASFTTSCENQVITLPTASRSGYTFNGWYDAASGGNRVGGAGEEYNPTTSPITLYAQWTEGSYTLTHSGSNYTNTENKTTIKSSDTPFTLNYTCTGDYGFPSTITISGGGKSWTAGTDYVWTVAADKQSATLTINQTTISANVTITINMATRYTVTFEHHDKGAFDGESSIEVLSSENTITLPTIEDVSCGFYDTFEGWIVSNSEYVESTTKPATVYAGGASYKVTGDCTFRALYSKCEGDATQVYRKVTATGEVTDGTYILVANTSTPLVYSGHTDGKDYGDCISGLTADGNDFSSTLPAGAVPVTVAVGGSGVSIYNGTKFIVAGTSTGVSDDASYWQLTDGSQVNAKTCPQGVLQPINNSTYVLLKNNTYDRFKTYENSQSAYVFLYKLIDKCTKYYSTNPSCEKPVGVHIVYHANAVDANMSCDTQHRTYKVENEVNKYPQLASQLQFCTNATREGYTLVGWNTQENGQGTTYNINQNYYNLPVSGELDDEKWITLNLYAMWKPCIKFNLGNATGGTGVPDAIVENGECVLPEPTAEQLGTIPCAYEFYAWSETSVNATQSKPTVWMPGDTYTGSATTLYAVYRYAEGMGGSDTYYFTFNKSGKTYCITAKHNSYDRFVVAEQSTGLIFGLENGYLYYLDENGVKNYVYYEGSSTYVTTTTTYPNNANQKTTFVEGDNGTTMVTPAISGRYLQMPSSYTDRAYYTNDGINPTLVEVEAATYTYATNPTCYTTANLHFMTNGGTLNYPTSYDETNYQELTAGSTVLLPTATFAGEWTFEGWKRGEPLENQTDLPYDPSFYPVTLDATLFEVDEVGDIYFYAVYSKTVDDKQFDKVNGGTYKLYAIQSDDTKIFMPAWNGGRGTMSGVTECYLTGDYTITPGTGEHAGQYQITCGGHTLGVVGDIDQTDLNEVDGTWWNIEPSESGKGTWRITVVGSSNRALSALSTSFGNYSLTQLNNAGQTQYRDMEIGECIFTEYTSTPENIPYITITGAPVRITSTNGERVYASTTIHIEAHNFTGERIIHLSATNGFGVDPVQVRTNGQGVYSGNVKVYYEPTTDGDGQTITTSVLTAAQTGGTTAEQISQTFSNIQGRNLPANFVIAAKWDGHWYALPANCTSSNSSTEGLLIEVDDVDNPTRATQAPASAKYGIREVIPSRQTDHGQGVVFTERYSDDNKEYSLYNNGTSANLQVYSQYSNYAATNPERYEWTPSTTNFVEYTLTNANSSRKITLNNSGVFSATTASGQVRLLPATFYEPAPVQVLKWKENSVIVMYTGAETTATTQVGTNAVSAAQTLENQKLTHGIYELTTSQALTGYARDVLVLCFGANTKVEMEIPLIVSGNVTASANGHDVVILENSKLTAAATKYSYKDVYVYGGGKLAVPASTSLGVNNIILRAGGIATNGAGADATYQYIYPEVELKGTFSSTKTDIKYEYVTDYDHWYHFVLPFDGNIKSITYPTEYYGDHVALDNTGSWVIKRYDGATRVTGNYNAWVDIESEAATTTTAGKGYIFWGAPKKVSVNGGTKVRQQWGIQRITMPITSAAKAVEAETGDKTIEDLGSYANVANNSGAVNDQGWNLIGNPYMVNLTTMAEDGLKAGKLEKEIVDGNWTGKWINNGDNLRYLTIPSEHFDTYEAKTVSEAISANALVPGRAFFVQLEGEANGITFAAANRASLMPQHLAAQNTAVEVETGIVLSSETMQDEVNFWIKDGKTNDYEYNADYPKTPNSTNFNIYGVHINGNLSWVATGPEYAEESMPIGYQVPAAGTYTLSISETYFSDLLDALFVTDHAMSPELTVDLMNAPYEFSVNQAETNNERFTVSVILKSENQGPTTGLENAGVQRDGLTKFIYQDKMFILHNGIIYDATGKKVTTINK